MNKLRRRFIVFNMIVISVIAVALAVLIYFGSPAPVSLLQMLGIIIIMIALVGIGSFLLSNIAIKPIQAAWQRQLEFTADASHELRTPLAVMQTNLELVIGNADETVGSQKKWLDNIHTETIRMGRLVEDLLTLSRSDVGAKVLEYSGFSLNALAKETCERFEASAEQKEIAIQVVAEKEIQFYADASRIDQLLSILVDNAVKYMGRPGNIQIVISEKNQVVQLIVSDTGMGIENEHLPKIFRRFYRAGSEKQLIDGFGLGLSIADWIVREHGGNIHAESVSGEGTRFAASFPKKRMNMN